MGNKNSKKIDLDVNVDKIKIPSDYMLLKIATYNINLKTGITVDEHIKQAISYIFASYKNKNIDIIALQGINNKENLKEFIRYFNEYVMINNISIYISYASKTNNNSLSLPDMKYSRKRNYSFNDIPCTNNLNFDNDINNSKLSKSFNMTWSNSGSSDIDKGDDAKCLIISRYVINNYNFHKINNNAYLTNCVININNNKLSIFSIYILNNIDDDDNESNIDKIFLHINTINDNLSEKTTPSIVLGHYNIEEYYNKDISNSYTNIIKKYKLVDLYRFLNPDKPGYTNKHNRRYNYVCFMLNNDVISFNEPKDIMQYIFKYYNIHFISSIVRNDLIHSLYFPIETLLMIKKNL